MGCLMVPHLRAIRVLRLSGTYPIGYSATPTASTTNKPQRQLMTRMIDMFPVEEIVRALKHIDRFDSDVVDDKKVAAEKAIDVCEKVSDQIIESDA